MMQGYLDYSIGGQLSGPRWKVPEIAALPDSTISDVSLSFSSLCGSSRYFMRVTQDVVGDERLHRMHKCGYSWFCLSTP